MKHFRNIILILFVIGIGPLQEFAGLALASAVIWKKDAEKPMSAPEVIVQEAGRYELTLDEVTRLALQNNFDIQLAKYDTWIKQTDADAVRSIFDTVFSAEVEYQNDQRKRTSTILGTKSVTNDYNIGLSRKVPTGTTIGVGLDNHRASSNSSFSTSPVVHDSAARLSVQQDLGKNFFGVQDRGQIKLTDLDIKSAEYTSLEKIEDSVSAVQKGYWSLVLAYEELAIGKDMLEQAKLLYELNSRKEIDGLAEIPDVLGSEANYRKRLNELMMAHNAVSSAANKLGYQLNIANEDVTLFPVEQLRVTDTVPEITQALKQAVANRPDYRKVLNDVKAKNIKISLKKNSLWPEINVSATLRRNGLGDHFNDAVTNISEEDNPDLSAMVSFTFPLENREARAELKAAELEKARMIIRLKQVERKIAVEIADHVRDCKVYFETARNSEDIARIESMKLSEEEKRFNRGLSDTDTVVRFQEDVIRSRWEAVQAKYRYVTALIDLKQAEGVLLNEYWDGEL